MFARKDSRNGTMMNVRTALRWLTLLALAGGTAAYAAKPQSDPSGLPKDPAALLALAAQQNGLEGPGLKPWHIKASYQLYDAKGNPTAKGTFEEWWAGKQEDTIIFDGPEGHEKIVTNAKGIFVLGKDGTSYPQFLVKRLYDDPVSAKLPGKGMKLHFNEEKFGTVKLACVEEIPKGLQPTGFHEITTTFPTYCMEPTSPILRIFGSYGQSLVQVTDVGTLEGRYLPLDAVIFNDGHKYVSVHLDQGESAPQWPPTLFTASPGSTSLKPPTSQSINLSSKDISSRKLGGKNPIYPESAKEHHQEGRVILSALIGQDGEIRSLVVTTAPAMSLADSALVAVKTWKYKPYLLNRYPVNVETTINVIYSLGD
jgi:TonB family protein